ncbi:WXG100 family type VII secretion target [Kitasatospora viridis]|uniref:Type VII secretion system (Wss) protein ESAT-6 n=1 Tax=Kitasatospora viridis TaxID=281105 RepID=A0A561UDA0_9ACTN|nr:hypothetical protein [Kitasatospora viridis]TWF97352.1 hypothetical protein FHX73_111132 [Kitasatospora viridis]
MGNQPAQPDISIHPDEVLAAAPTFTTQSQRLDSAITNLTSALQGLGSPWGADDPGKKFGAAYTPQRDQLLKSLGVLVKGLASVHLGLEAMAGNHQGNDTAVAATLAGSGSADDSEKARE